MEKNNKGLKVVIILLIIALLGVSGYFVFYTQKSNECKCEKTDCISNNDVEEKNINKKHEYINKCYDDDISECLIFDASEAEKIVSNYVGYHGEFVDDINDFDILWTQLRKDNVGTNLKCKEVFNDDKCYTEDNEYSDSYKYDVVLKKLKELYGDNSILERQDYYFENCGLYRYSSELDSFVFAGFEGCGYDHIVSKGVEDAYQSRDTLYIFTYEFSAGAGDPSSLEEKVMIFKKIDNNYYLESVERL